MPPDDYSEAKRRAPDRVSLLGVKLPPPPPKRPLRDDEATPIEPIVTMARERASGFPPTSGPLPPVHPARPQKTLIGPAVRPAKGAAPEPPPVSTPVPQMKSDPPPRNLSPAPTSGEIKVETSLGKFSFKTAVLRHVWTLLAPLVLSGVGVVLGYFKGYYYGLTAAHDDLVKLQGQQKHDHDSITQLRTDLDALAGSSAQEATSNRAERATAMARISQFAADLEQVKSATPKIQGLAKPRP